MKTSEQIFLSIAVSIVLLVAIVVGAHELKYRMHESARIAKDRAAKIERAGQMAKLRDEQRAEDEIRHAQDEARRASEKFEERLSRYGYALRDYARAHPNTSEYWDVAAARKVQIGMAAELVRIALGEPNRIHKTLTSRTESEQWVYGDNYVYIDDGVCTAIQTTH